MRGWKPRCLLRFGVPLLRRPRRSREQRLGTQIQSDGLRSRWAGVRSPVALRRACEASSLLVASESRHRRRCWNRFPWIAILEQRAQLPGTPPRALFPRTTRSSVVVMLSVLNGWSRRRGEVCSATSVPAARVFDGWANRAKFGWRRRGAGGKVFVP